MGGYAVVAIKGYQAGVGGEGVGVQPPGLFFFFCVEQLFWFVRPSLHVFTDPQRFVWLCKSPQPAGVENRCIFIHKVAYECIMMQNPPHPLVNNVTPGS